MSICVRCAREYQQTTAGDIQCNNCKAEEVFAQEMAKENQHLRNQVREFAQALWSTSNGLICKYCKDIPHISTCPVLQQAKDIIDKVD